ncbi:hypothetical protein [Robiginitomaculum antarcticum]|uniref:hypothetical protein n=1 Tax=Robiginitomaculum antarcticum TaxID=437507 RepID=UPI00037D8A3C|nr:hypothetical protein [Robiginitomaculum antarcticum]
MAVFIASKALILTLIAVPMLIQKCDDGSSTIKVTAINCAVEDTVVTAAGKSTAKSGNQWHVRFDVSVTCKGKPVKGAQIEASFWWGKSRLMTTGNLGKATYARTVHGDPSGMTADFTVEGSGGQTTTGSFTVP